MKKLFITTLIFVFIFFQQGHISADDITISISGSIENKTKLILKFTETEKVFDPKEVYKDSTNPTKL